MRADRQLVGWLTVAGLGVGLIVVGWSGALFERAAPLGYPASIEVGDPHHADLLATLQRLERAADAGDVAALRSGLTERYHAELQAQLEALGGGDLDPLTLHEQLGFLGFTDQSPLLAGRGRGSRAVLVYFFDLDPAGLDRTGVRGRLRGYVFDGADGRPRLDRKVERELDHDRDPTSGAAQFANELLD